MSERRSAAEDVQDLLWKAGRILDDPSAEFIVQVREAGVFTDEDWDRVLGWIAEALDFLGRPNETARADAEGRLVLGPDSDPRNADWLRLATAARLAGHHLPLWSAMWLWRIGHERGAEYWDAVGRVAEAMGYPRHPDARRRSHLRRQRPESAQGETGAPSKRHKRGNT